MSPFDVRVQVFDEFDGGVSGDWLRQIAEATLALESRDPEASLSVVIANDQVVRGLNRRHRGLDENTDVLAFSFTHQGEYYGRRGPSPPPTDEEEFALPPGEQNSLGEVIVSYPQAQRQAALSGRPMDVELAVLLAHGVLHLLGHDHQGPGEEAAMRRIEDRVLARVRGKV